LTRAQIIQAAIEVLDAEGLDGLSMRGLGARLGSAATAVYWHIKGKDRLVMLAGDEVWREIELPEVSATRWRAAAATMAKDLYAMFTRHTWLVQAFSSGAHLTYGPGKARYDDHSLAIYEMAGFVGAEAAQAAATVFVFALGSALGATANVALERRLGRAGGDADELVRDIMVRASEIAQRFPRLRAHIEEAQAAGYAAAPEGSFAFGLQAILDGFEARLAVNRKPTGKGAH
jgi:AcrR family transcriptional regulator